MFARLAAYVIVVLFFVFFALTPVLAVLKVMAKMVGSQFTK